MTLVEFLSGGKISTSHNIMIEEEKSEREWSEVGVGENEKYGWKQATEEVEEMKENQ